MTKVLLVVFAALFCTTATTYAANYGLCANSIAENAGRLIVPVEPIKSATVLSPDIIAVLVGGTPNIGDSVLPVYKQYYNEELYDALLENFEDHGAWIGVIEGIDRDEVSALWMKVFAATDNGCIISTVDDRVYSARANAPYVFSEAISAWEAQHPESKLYYYFEFNS